jgi:hypothetical protein
MQGGSRVIGSAFQQRKNSGDLGTEIIQRAQQVWAQSKIDKGRLPPQWTMRTPASTPSGMPARYAFRIQSRHMHHSKRSLRQTWGAGMPPVQDDDALVGNIIHEKAAVVASYIDTSPHL